MSKLAADLHYGNNNDPLVPHDLLMDALGANLSDDQNDELDGLLEQLDEREQLATFDLLKHATEPPEIDDDFNVLAAEAELLFDENLSGPGMYGTAPRLNEPEIAYQLQKISEQDPGRALGLKWLLDGMLNPDQRAELDRALAGEASWSDRVERGIAHPVDGLEGAAKGTWNNTFGWALDEWANLTVGIAVASQHANRNPMPRNPYGYDQTGWLPSSWEEIDAVVEFELEMDNIAQQGGADIAEAIEIASSVYGAGKGGLTLVRVGRNYFLRSRGRIVAAVGGAGTPPFNSRGQLQRQGNRIVFRQAPGSMDCGPTSCAMGLDTLGHQVDDVDAFVRRFNVAPWGTTAETMVDDLGRMGINATRRTDLTIDEIAAFTRNGSPMIVHVKQPSGAGHFVIVDGVTTRYGKRVVAVRDPAGRQYFEDVETFEARAKVRQGITFEE